jgi:hypothetical protein
MGLPPVVPEPSTTHTPSLAWRHSTQNSNNSNNSNNQQGNSAGGSVQQALAELGQQLLSTTAAADGVGSIGGGGACGGLSGDVLMSAARQHLMAAPPDNLTLRTAELLLADCSRLAAAHAEAAMLARCDSGCFDCGCGGHVCAVVCTHGGLCLSAVGWLVACYVAIDPPPCKHVCMMTPHSVQGFG